MAYLFDTNVVSELRRPDRAHRKVLEWSRSIDENEVYLSVITRLELERGVLKAERKTPDHGRALRRWMTNIVEPTYRSRMLDITTAVALRAASFVSAPNVELADHLIAATASVHQLTLVTRNIADFKNIDVAVLNPWSE